MRGMAAGTGGHPHVGKSFSDAVQSDLRIQHFKGVGARKVGGRSTLISQAALANEISAYLFGYLEGFRISTHFVEMVSECDMLVRKVDLIPLQVLVHNVASGTYCTRFGLREGTELIFPVLEHYLAKPEITTSLVNEFHIYSLGLATPDQLRAINRLASKANVVLRSFFERRELKLISIAFQFGLLDNQIIVADEISPRTCLFSNMRTKGKGDRLSRNGPSGIESYIEIRNQILGQASMGVRD